MEVTAYIPTPEEWGAVLSRLASLEASTPQPAAVATTEAGDRILTSSEAASYLGMKGGPSVTKARRAGRLQGVMINEKEWGFRTSELTRYLNRHQRPAR